MTSKIQRSNSVPNVQRRNPKPSPGSSKLDSTQFRPRTHSMDAGRSLTGRLLTQLDGTPVLDPHSPQSLQIMNTLSEAVHFERTIRVGNFLYKITTELPDDPELNEGYLQTNLLPQVTKAIELATQEDSLKSADQFDLEFKPEGLSATPYRSMGESSGSSIRLDNQQTRFESTEAAAICENVRRMLDNPRAYIEKRPDKTQERQSSSQTSSSSTRSRRARAEQLPPPSSTTLPIAPNSPVPFLEHGANSCFLAVFIWTYLSNHQEIREELRAKAAVLNNRSWLSWPWSQSAEDKAKDKAILALDAFATNLEKHQAAGTYVPKSDINRLRSTLALLRPTLFQKDELTQNDTHEAMTVLLGMFDRASKTQIDVYHTVGDKERKAPPHHDLILPLPVRSSDSTQVLKKRDGSNFNLQEILGDHFNSDSQFDYRDSDTQVVVKAKGTTYRMSKCPRYLEITLGRLNDFHQKINGDIDVPLEMTLTEMITDETPSPTYRLRSVIRHEGSSSNGGHFTSIVRKDEVDGVHNYHCDDIGSSNANGACSSVKEVNDAYCLEKAKGAYMLVYEKIEKAETPVS